MAELSGTSANDWSGISLAQVNIESDIIRFADRVDQILAEAADDSFFVISETLKSLIG